MKRKLWSKTGTPQENARAVLPRLAKKFFSAGRKAASEKSPAGLHKFSLRVKQFRYALEAFEPVYGPSMEIFVADLRKVQQLLGTLNDGVATEGLLKARPDAKDEAIAAVIALARSRAKDKGRKFRKYWKQEFDAAGREAAWRAWLGGETPVKRSRPGRAAKSG
jgi:CHAD domain-containing protein